MDFSDPKQSLPTELGMGDARWVGRLVFVFCAFALGLWALGAWMHDNALYGAGLFVDTFGVFGVAAGFFVPDLCSLPLPQDAFCGFALLGGLGFWSTGVAASVGSIVGGASGYAIARWARRSGWMHPRFQARYAHRISLMQRYGSRALAFSAVAPVPYAPVCWACGLVALPLRTFLLVSLLRVPRVFCNLWLLHLGVLYVF